MRLVVNGSSVAHCILYSFLHFVRSLVSSFACSFQFSVGSFVCLFFLFFRLIVFVRCVVRLISLISFLPHILFVRPSQFNVSFPIALPLVRVGRSVGQKKKRKRTLEGVWVPEKAGLLSTKAWLQSQLENVVPSFVSLSTMADTCDKFTKREESCGLT